MDWHDGSRWWSQRGRFSIPSNAIFAAYPIRQGNLRACTEAFPGDRHISQRDEEWFGLDRTFTSTPFMYVVLTAQRAVAPTDNFHAGNQSRAGKG